MKILVVGGGGREHAIVWKIAQSPRVTRIYCAPGNPGIAELATLVPIPIDQIDALLKFAVSERIELTVVGPEIPLSLGIVDRFEAAGLNIFGPSRAASEIETSKFFSKQLMQKYHIPTARAEVVTQQEGYACLSSFQYPLVLKADGLAGGKGVVIAETEKDAIAGLDAFKKLGHAADKILLEEYLVGVEASFFALNDGVHVLPLTSAQDHKQLFDGNQGPNTGGMGAISPAPAFTTEIETAVMEQIIHPTLAGLANEGRPYRGILYAGLMFTSSGISVLEFNARWGDPEAQAIFPRLQVDWVAVMEATQNRSLDTIQLQWADTTSLCVVLAAGGYPGHHQQGDKITGLSGWDRAGKSETQLFHAGTVRRGEALFTAGGRVLGVVGQGRSAAEARDRVYRAIGSVSFNGMHYRKDIGHCRVP